MSFPAGWYDDPQDPTQQRYWDGDSWTDQRRAQQGPPPYQGQFGEQPAQHGQVYGDAQPGPAQYGQYSGQPPMAPYQQQGHPQQGYPQQGYPQQGYGYPGQKIDTTPDGQLLSGWWRRVFAYLLDSIIIWFVGLPLTGYFYWQYIKIMRDYLNEVADAAAAGTPPPTFALASEVYQWLIPAALIGIAVTFVYQFLFLTRKGATPGKMALGIAVRLRDVPGRPPSVAALKRCGFFVVLGLLGFIPVIGLFVVLFAVIDYLWPLWDDKKQALHDKVAATNVVRV